MSSIALPLALPSGCLRLACGADLQSMREVVSTSLSTASMGSVSALSEPSTATAAVSSDSSHAPHPASRRVLKLIAVDEGMLTHVLGGGLLEIKSRDEGEVAVMCTHDASYALTMIDSSNTLFGAGVDGATYTLHAVFNGHVEMAPCAPPLHAIRDALRYSGEYTLAQEVGEDELGPRKRRREGDSAPAEAGVTLDELDATVACSRAQLRRALCDMSALAVRDRFQLVGTDLTLDVLRAVITSADAGGWSLSSLPLGDIITDLRDRFPAPLVEHVLRSHATADTPRLLLPESSWPPDDTRLPTLTTLTLSFKLYAMTVARALLRSETVSVLLMGLASPCATPAATAPILHDASAAEALLHNAGAVRHDALPWLAAQPFLTRWAARMPHASRWAEGAAGEEAKRGVGLDIISGVEALLDEDAATGRVILRIFPVAELDHRPAQRFKQLFAVRAKWRLTDLQPFLAPLEGYGVKAADLLLAHTRTTLLPDGTRIFSAR